VLAALVAPARDAGARPVFSCADRYVVIRAHGPLVGRSADALVVGPTTLELAPRCPEAAFRVWRAGRGWRLAARWSRCADRRRVVVRARLTADCTLVRGTVAARASRRTAFTAIASRCGDGVVDPGAGEACDDGNLTSGDGCEPYCATCDASAPPFAGTWAAIVTRVFVRQRCAGCHGSAHVAGLDLRPDSAYASLVGVPALTVAGLARVAPGNPAGSLLWNVLAKGLGAPGADDLPGIAMPIGGRLTPEDVEAVRLWIAAGAPELGVVPGTEAFLAPCSTDSP
jgi:cysteine-rich repeat protein